jgi:hypothetical protein
VKIWNIDYTTEGDTAKIVSVKGHPTEQGAIDAKQGDNDARAMIRTEGDMASLGQPIIDALAAKYKVTEATPAAIWVAFNPVPKSRLPKVALEVKGDEGNDAKVTKEKNVAKKKVAKKTAKKKVAAKKKAAAPKTKRVSTGPRGGKTLEIKRLLLRKNGCTRKDVLAATGWVAVSMQAMAKACGLKLRQEKVKGTPISYFGSEK